MTSDDFVLQKNFFLCNETHNLDGYSKCQYTGSNRRIYILRYVHILNSLVNVSEGTIMTISKDRVKPSPLPDSWKLPEIFATGIVMGSYLAIMTVVFFWAAHRTRFFQVLCP